MQQNRIKSAFAPAKLGHPYTKEELKESVGELESNGVADERDMGFLNEIVDHVFNFMSEYTNLDKLTEAIGKSYKRLGNELGAVGETIRSMLVATTTGLKELVDTLSLGCIADTLIRVLCGALDGANTGAEVAGMLNLRNKARHAALGALAGAACATATVRPDVHCESCDGNASG